MRVGAFRRISSYLLDIIPILVVCSLLFNYLLVGWLEPEGYDEIQEQYTAYVDEYYEKMDELLQKYENEELSEEDYLVQQELVLMAFNRQTDEYVVEIFMFEVVTKIIYYTASATLIYYFYSLILKGRTVGRRLMRIELGGKVTWWRLLLHEVIWKTGYWMLTAFIGGILLDMAMIAFSKKKQAPRDIVSGLYVKYEGVEF